MNECRVQNATVRLAPGDLLKFGYNGVPFTLEIENPPPVCILFFVELVFIYLTIALV